MNEDFQKELQEVARVLNDTTRFTKEQIDSLVENVFEAATNLHKHYIEILEARATVLNNSIQKNSLIGTETFAPSIPIHSTVIVYPSGYVGLIYKEISFGDLNFLESNLTDQREIDQALISEFQEGIKFNYD